MSAENGIPVDKFRLVCDGEVIEANDECLSHDCITWDKPASWAFGCKYNPNFFVPFRRRV